MGLFENEEEKNDKSFIKNGINKSSLLDLVNWWGKNKIEIYNIFKNTDILENVSEDLRTEVYRSTPNNVDFEESLYYAIYGALTFSLLRGMKNSDKNKIWDIINEKFGLNYFNSLVGLDDLENQNVLDKFLILIPNLKETVYKLKENINSEDSLNIKPKQTNTIETPTISADQYISKLNYSDVGYDNVDAGGSMRKYAEALSKEDATKVEKTAKKLVDTFRKIIQYTFNKEISRAGMSESWAYWDIGKQLYMNANQDESSDEYVLANPLEDETLFWEMVYRMIGWEMTKGGKKPDGSKYSSWELKDVGKKLYDEKNTYK